MVLLVVKAFAGSKVQLIPAIGTEQKPVEQSLPFRFCGTAFVCPQFLYPFKDGFLNDCFMGIAENRLLFFCGGNPLFQFVGF